MNADLKSILPKINVIFEVIRKHVKILFTVFVVLIYAFLVYRVDSLSLAEPTEEAIDQALAEVKAPKIDQTAIDAIDQLESRSIEVKALFEQARDNPFQD